MTNGQYNCAMGSTTAAQGGRITTSRENRWRNYELLRDLAGEEVSLHYTDQVDTTVYHGALRDQGLFMRVEIDNGQWSPTFFLDNVTHIDVTLKEVFVTGMLYRLRRRRR